MGRARVRVTGELLVDVLHFPPGTVVLAVDEPFEVPRDVFELVVEHPDLPALPPGAEPPLASPVYLTETTVGSHATITFAGWGLPTPETTAASAAAHVQADALEEAGFTDGRLAELERLAVAATPGPWEVNGTPGEPWRRIAHRDGCIDVYLRRNVNGDNDAAFIAAARTGVPELLAEVRRLRAALAAEREACARVADELYDPVEISAAIRRRGDA